MALDQTLKELRKANGLSQEKVAELVGVSRQAVTKWETGRSLPSSENMIALAALFHVSLDELVGNPAGAGRQPNPILRANLTILAIILQASFMNVCAQALHPATRWGAASSDTVLHVYLFLLTLCSIWMACNLRYEKDPARRSRNCKIEMLYCWIQLAASYLSLWIGVGLLSTLLTGVICFVYLLVINPKYMGRKLVRQKPSRA